MVYKFIIGKLVEDECSDWEEIESLEGEEVVVGGGVKSWFLVNGYFIFNNYYCKND